MWIETLRIDSDKLDEQFLQESIIEAERPEGKTIDYKVTFNFKCYGINKLKWDDNENKKLEFLTDVSSFANASGGALIYGIKSEGGIPTEIAGMQIQDKYTETIHNHLNTLVLSHIKPRIEVRYYPVRLETCKKAYVLDILRSWTGPHQVTFLKHNKFYARSEAMHKYELDIDQLRAAFVRSRTLIDEMREFRTARITLVRKNFACTELPLSGDAMTLLHLIPFYAFDLEKNQYEGIEAIFSDNNALEPMFRPGFVGYLGPSPKIERRFNFDGVRKSCYYVFEKKFVDGETKRTLFSPYSYTQLFTNGIVEACERRMLNGTHAPNEKYIDINSFEQRLINSLDNYLKTLQYLGVTPQIFLFLTMLGVKDYELLRSGTSYPGLFGGKIDRDVLKIPETYIETYNIKPEIILKPCFDSIWNACGYPASLNYDEESNHSVTGSDQRLKKIIDYYTSQD